MTRTGLMKNPWRMGYSPLQISPNSKLGLMRFEAQIPNTSDESSSEVKNVNAVGKNIQSRGVTTLEDIESEYKATRPKKEGAKLRKLQKKGLYQRLSAKHNVPWWKVQAWCYWMIVVTYRCRSFSLGFVIWNIVPPLLP
ncbi:hypothetical protein GOBAR_AA34040 [Gossypium barbadense]|uniref:Uncharacterized protein n=1 Tax=Gossypium barbadense TaxID=3634 RepID=A0A2P5W6B6_GOSBA|nr:hypothetical protein GOBAR_AA34040 [Gossypium barbadense]